MGTRRESEHSFILRAGFFLRAFRPQVHGPHLGEATSACNCLLCARAAGLPLLQYSKSSKYLEKALKGRQSFLHALESEGEQADDMVVELVQRAVHHYFETHNEDLEISELTRVEFWTDEEKASAMLDQVLQATNSAVRQAFDHVRVGIPRGRCALACLSLQPNIRCELVT